MTQPGIADLLAGAIDLVPSGTPPHRPGPCTALCVPACGGEAATDSPGGPTSATPANPTAVTELAGPR